MEKPKVLLLDEPFNGIDRVSVSNIKKYFNNIKKDVIIIITSHIAEDISDICDNILELEDGNLVIRKQDLCQKMF